MKKLFLSLTLVLAFSTVQAGLFTHKPKDTPEQKVVKAQSFPVFCPQCTHQFVLKPIQAAANGGHTDANGLAIIDWGLSFKCPNCKTVIHGKYQSFADPIQTVAPLPPLPKVEVAKPLRSKKLTTSLPPAPQTVEWRRTPQ